MKQTPDKPTTEPRTAETEAFVQKIMATLDPKNMMPSTRELCEIAIRRAQEQARREAIEDCFVICSKHINTEYADINIRDEICALLKEDMHALSAKLGGNVMCPNCERPFDKCTCFICEACRAGTIATLQSYTNLVYCLS